jgi:hypothetical protein
MTAWWRYDSFYRRPWKRDKIPENKLCD